MYCFTFVFANIMVSLIPRIKGTARPFKYSCSYGVITPRVTLPSTVRFYLLTVSAPKAGLRAIYEAE